MKKSGIAMLVVFFICIPLTIYLGSKLPGRNYYIAGTLIIIELMAPLFMAFEKRKPQAREIIVIAILCALGIASRVIVPIPHFKPTFAVIMLSGIAFGPEVGFMVGAMSAFGSNFFMGQGPYTPWQMMAYGAGGMLAGFLFAEKRLPTKPVILACFGFAACMLWVGPLLDLSGVFLMQSEITKEGVLAMLAAGIPVNAMQGLCTVLVMLLFGKTFLEKMDRVKMKYGMLESENGI